MNISIKNILAYLIVVLTVVSLNPWSTFPVGNTFTSWSLYLIIILVIINTIKTYKLSVAKKELLYVKLFLAWVAICFVRGLFAAEFYWDYKNLLNVTFGLLLLLSIWVLMNPKILQHIFSKWITIALPLFVIVLLVISPVVYGFYLVPISVLSLFLPALNRKWKWMVLGILLFVILSSLDARSNVIKFVVPILLSFLYYQKKILKLITLKKVYKTLFLLPVLLLLLAIFNVFNIFKMDDYITGNYTTIEMQGGKLKESSLTADTRTFIYVEVIESAIRHSYVLLGRTAARGYDSDYFGNHSFEDLGTGRYERYGSEVSIMNIFTWLGIIGVMFYFLVFFKAVTLAISHSNNTFIKIVGLYVLFRWCYAWVEDFNGFSIMNVMLCAVIAMCYSPAFRNLSDKEFKFWVRGIFDKRYRLADKQQVIHT